MPSPPLPSLPPLPPSLCRQPTAIARKRQGTQPYGACRATRSSCRQGQLACARTGLSPGQCETGGKGSQPVGGCQGGAVAAQHTLLARRTVHTVTASQSGQTSTRPCAALCCAVLCYPARSSGSSWRRRRAAGAAAPRWPSSWRCCASTSRCVGWGGVGGRRNQVGGWVGGVQRSSHKVGAGRCTSGRCAAPTCMPVPVWRAPAGMSSSSPTAHHSCLPAVLLSTSRTALGRRGPEGGLSSF